jgi:hypothetical protein
LRIAYIGKRRFDADRDHCFRRRTEIETGNRDARDLLTDRSLDGAHH